MSLRDVLAKMKLVELDGPPAAAAPPERKPAPAGAEAPARPQPARKPKTVEELLAQAPAAPEVEPARVAPTGAPAQAVEEGPDFESVYKAAGVREPAHGFSAPRVLAMLESKELAALDGKARAAALVGFLKINPAGPISSEDIVRDAVARDTALDAWQQAWKRRLDARAEEVWRENETLQREAEELRLRHEEKMQANLKQLEAERTAYEKWSARKRIEEQRLHQAVEPFVEENPITRTGGYEP